MLLTENQIKIKPLLTKHVTRKYLNWFSDNEIKKYVVNTRYKKIDELKKYVLLNSKKRNILFLGIFLKNNKHIGNIKFEQINIKKKSAVMGILIGKKRFRNKGYSSNALLMSMKYLNKKYKIRYFWLGVNKKNLPAIASYKKAGFRIFKEKNKNYKMLRDFNLLNLNRFSLGSAQFGMDYGVNNIFGKTKFKQVKKIIEYAKNLGIKNIDTAIAYGEAEKILGKAGVKKFKVTSKLPFIEKSKLNEIKQLVKKSLYDLKKDQLECLLIHSSKNLNNDVHKILNEMNKLKKIKLVKKIGISTNNFKDLLRIIKKFKIDVIQVPYNILDKRLNNHKIASIIKAKNIEVQIRSIFLQGLLFKKYNKITNHLKPIISKNKKLKIFLSNNKKKKLNDMLNYSYKNLLAKNIIIGVEKLSQLKDISKVKLNEKNNFQEIKNNLKILINPNLW